MLITFLRHATAQEHTQAKADADRRLPTKELNRSNGWPPSAKETNLSPETCFAARCCAPNKRPIYSTPIYPAAPLRRVPIGWRSAQPRIKLGNN